jgi:hypothetical protein
LQNNAVLNQAVDGVQREPRTIGYDPVCHLFLPNTIIDFNRALHRCQLEREAWINDILTMIRALKSKKFYNKELLRGGKECSLGVDLIFMALPTGYQPDALSDEAPLWTKYNHLFSMLFFKAAEEILTDTGCLALLYANNFQHIADIREGMGRKSSFKHLWTWTVLVGPEEATWFPGGIQEVSSHSLLLCLIQASLVEVHASTSTSVRINIYMFNTIQFMLSVLIKYLFLQIISF